MNSTSLALVALLVPTLAALVRIRSTTAPRAAALPPPKRPGAQDPARTPAPAAPLAAPAPVEWDKPLPKEPARIRDEYIAARFPGIFRGSADLREVERVIKIARLLFEEGRMDRADELFALAIEQSASPLALRLAQLEIAFLRRDTPHFVGLAQALKERHPAAAEWPEVARLGHALAPGDSLFSGDRAGSEGGHYGPWPDMPNWIQASWDLTPEVLAVDFHHVIAGFGARHESSTARRVA